jgi:hypothetical protein
MIERVEIGGPDAFDQAESYADIADAMLGKLVAMYRPVSEEDREGLTALLERHGGELGEFLASIRCRFQKLDSSISMV